MEIRNKVLCALGKSGRTGLQIARYFKILGAPYLVLFVVQFFEFEVERMDLSLSDFHNLAGITRYDLRGRV